VFLPPEGVRMLAVLLLTASFSTTQAAPSAPAPPSRAFQTAAPVLTMVEAMALADTGRLDEALAAFRALAAANPDDREARLWIARMHERMGHPTLAEPVYRSVLLETPADVRAMIGVGSTLLARREYREAITMLEAAEALDRNNAEVLVLLGRAHSGLGDEERSLPYLERAMAIDPAPGTRRSIELTAHQRRHRVEADALAEQFNGSTEDTQGAGVEVNVRLSERFRLSGLGQWQRKFGRRDERAGAGVEWRMTRRSTVVSHAAFGPDNEVLPQHEWYLAIAHSASTAGWTLGYRYLDFPGARASVIGPGVSWAATDRLTIDLRYDAVISEFVTVSGTTNGHSEMARGTYLVRPRVAAFASVARGIENFDAVSIDRIGDFEANTLSGGVRVDFRTLTALVAEYDHQWRPNDLRMQRFTISLRQSF
jgi:YaiO family outer membrane protein